ncbi:HEAT repeat domain-containing protein [Streptomyces althioticus]|uniref:HEAT repeat domain-containing protein n=1 Tax=Streptomyces althioticus TaxID=83380 RepID=UPI0038169386
MTNDPYEALGAFLRRQAENGGMGPRDIEQCFTELAAEEAQAIEAGAPAQSDLLSKMSFSKSHIDRLYRGRASLPSPRFVKIFLQITHRAAGLPRERHLALWNEARDLLAAASARPRRRGESAVPTRATSQAQDSALANLQLQLQLERAHRNQDKLRWALSDAQLLMNTLLQIISALRDIIADLDARQAHALRMGTSQAHLAATDEQRDEAFSHKHKAEVQLDRVSQRRRALETLWEHARAELARLSLHPAITAVEPAYNETSQAPVALHQDLLARPALDDIANALARIDVLNTRHDQTTRDILHDLAVSAEGDGATPNPGTNVLVTDNSDASGMDAVPDVVRYAAEVPQLLEPMERTLPYNRETASPAPRAIQETQGQVNRNSLQAQYRTTTDSGKAVSGGDVEVRAALFNAARGDESSDVRIKMLRRLADSYPGDQEVRVALFNAARGDEEFLARVEALKQLADNYPGDQEVRDALFNAAQGDKNFIVRRTALERLADNYPGDQEVRVALFYAARGDESSDVRIKMLRRLADSYPGDQEVRVALFNAARGDEEFLARVEALEQLADNYPGDQEVRDALFNAAQGDRDFIVRRTALERLADNYPGDQEVRVALFYAARGDESSDVRIKMLRRLADNYPGDQEVRVALFNAARGDEEFLARVEALEQLADNYPGDQEVRDALFNAAQGDRDFIVRRTALERLGDNRTDGSDPRDS